MKNRPINLIFVSFLMSSSPAFSDNHLNRSIKFQDGERHANCVYGEGGTVTVKGESPGGFGGTKIFDYERQCGSGWEGAFLYQAFVRVRMNLASTLWDLQTAYNCCVHTDEDRSKICDQMDKGGLLKTFSTSWGQCAEYFGTMLGNVANVLPVIQQPEANEAVMMACIRAISGSDDFHSGKNSNIIKDKYYNRDDLLIEDCFKEEYLSKAAPYVFDYLRDYTGCLWNNPDDRFCSGSRRRMPGTPYGWENDR